VRASPECEIDSLSRGQGATRGANPAELAGRLVRVLLVDEPCERREETAVSLLDLIRLGLVVETPKTGTAC